jgi:hypothetical protein
MVKLLLGLTQPPSPHDAADALAVAICHLHSMPPVPRNMEPGTRSRNSKPGDRNVQPRVAQPRTWRQYRPRTTG